MKTTTNSDDEYIVINREDKKYFLRGTDIDYWPYAEVILANVYSPFKLKKTDIVLDLGANIGLFTVKFADKVDQIISVEPELENFNVLKKNIHANNLSNVKSLNVALSDKDEMLKIEGTSALAKVSDTGRSTKATTLDSVLEICNISKANVIKIDIEGYEAIVLKSFRGLEHVREIIVETHGRKTEKEVLRILKDKNFTVVNISDFSKKNVIKEIICHPLSFLAAEKKNNFAVTKLCTKYLMRLGPKPGYLSENADIEVFYGFRINNKNNK
ncbi:SAM-dependent methyltransferase tRNA -methyltransferase Translation protein [Marine Group I thaumarchaeote SCGC AAA799-B03]|uniref:SAM-dependent methyltransferase tRNA-methyltransferase Translation protein n=1 Tax=Marine Group I thaumarchaeote SCGC AAA799-B03 TaxID=1502289 RepID=A0A087S913_9ARCH|nr:SAM-dependent methyltransferase tRNA -methyltransferase Translation protein [Marine Group I thaumarchaeote SCGC AAA799-B03]